MQIRFLLIPGETTVYLSDDISALLTILWVVAMVNAVNLVDGLDGLAAGIVAIAASAFFVYAFNQSQEGLLGGFPSAPLMTIIIVGAALGFLRHNFHPARIFMGDSGAMLLGLVLGAATVVGIGGQGGGAGSETADVFLAYFPLLIPLAVIAIPLLDGLLAILRRARRRERLPGRQGAPPPPADGSRPRAPSSRDRDVRVVRPGCGGGSGVLVPQPVAGSLCVADSGCRHRSLHPVPRVDKGDPGPLVGLIPSIAELRPDPIWDSL